MIAILLTTLLVVSDDGKVSVIKNLSERECKILYCHTRQASTCISFTCTKDGEEIYPEGKQTCVQNGGGIRHIECIE